MTTLMITRRQQIERVLLDSKLAFSKRIEELCRLHDDSKFDVIFVLESLYHSNKLPLDTLISSLISLLSSQKKEFDKKYILNKLASHSGSWRGSSILLSPLLSVIIADHRLLPLCVPILLSNIKGFYEICRFLFGSDASSMFDSDMLELFRVSMLLAMDRKHQSIFTSMLLENSKTVLSSQSIQTIVSFADDHQLLEMALLSMHKDFPIEHIISKMTKIEINADSFDLIFEIGAKGTLDCLNLLRRKFSDDLSPVTVISLQMSAIFASLRIQPPSSHAGDLAALLSEDVFIDEPISSPIVCKDCDVALVKVGKYVTDFILSAGSNASLMQSCFDECIKDPACFEFVVHGLLLAMRSTSQPAECVRLICSIVDFCPSLSLVIVQLLLPLMERDSLLNVILLELSAHSKSLPFISLLLSRLDSIYLENAELFFDICQNLMKESDVRQSTLDFIASRLLRLCSVIVKAQHICGAIKCLAILVNLRYVAPQAVWNGLIVSSEWNKSKDAGVIESLVLFCGAFSLLPLVPTEDDPSVSGFSSETLNALFFVLEAFISGDYRLVNSSISCFLKFDISLLYCLLRASNVDMEKIVESLTCLADHVEIETAALFLSKILAREFSLMPRPQLIGSSFEKSSIAHCLPNGVFSTLERDEVVDKIAECFGGNVSSMPWFLKLQLKPCLSAYFDRLSQRSLKPSEDIFTEMHELYYLNRKSLAFYTFSVAALVPKLDAKVPSTLQNVKNVLGLLTADLQRSASKSDEMSFYLKVAIGSLQSFLGNEELADTSTPSLLAFCTYASTAALQQQVAHLEGKLQIPLLFSLSQLDCVNVQSKSTLQESEYVPYLQSLMSCSLSAVKREDAGKFLKRSSQFILKEPIDMQGTVAFLSSFAANRHSIDEHGESCLKQLSSVETCPSVRQVYILASLLPFCQRLEPRYNLFVSLSKHSKLFWYCDYIISKIILSQRNHKGAQSEAEPSLQRFFDHDTFGPVLKSLNDERVNQIILKALAMCETIPAGNWSELLRTGYQSVAGIQFLASHMVRADNRMAPSIVALAQKLADLEMKDDEFEAFVNKSKYILHPLAIDARKSLLLKCIENRHLDARQCSFLLTNLSLDVECIDRILNRTRASVVCVQSLIDIYHFMKRNTIDFSTIIDVHFRNSLYIISKYLDGPLEFVNFLSSYDTLKQKELVNCLLEIIKK